jgi:hypothetical protein
MGKVAERSKPSALDWAHLLTIISIALAIGAGWIYAVYGIL